jgi:putative phosphoribosyl transferase
VLISPTTYKVLPDSKPENTDQIGAGQATFRETSTMTAISYYRPIDRTMRIEMDGVSIEADWTMPMDAHGVVILVQGCGNSRFNRRTRMVAQHLYDQKFGTLLPDLLTPDEEREDALTAALRFDVTFLADRLLGATKWVGNDSEAAGLPIGYFGTGIGTGAALLAAAARPDLVSAVVSRAGRPDLAGIELNKVKAPTLLIAGGADSEILALNRWAYWRMSCERHLEVVKGASHLFEERGALEAATSLADEWFDLHLAAQHASF